MADAIKLFTMVVEAAIPYGIAFTVGQMLVNSFMKMAFKGYVEF